MRTQVLVRVFEPFPHDLEQRLHADQRVQLGQGRISQVVICVVAPLQSSREPLHSLTCRFTPKPHVAEQEVLSFQGVKSHDVNGQICSSSVSLSDISSWQSSFATKRLFLVQFRFLAFFE